MSMTIADRIEKRIRRANKRRESALRAIARHAGRVKNGKSHFDVDDHMNAILALANFGLANIDSSANISREKKS